MTEQPEPEVLEKLSDKITQEFVHFCWPNEQGEVTVDKKRLCTVFQINGVDRVRFIRGFRKVSTEPTGRRVVMLNPTFPSKICEDKLPIVYHEKEED